MTLSKTINQLINNPSHILPNITLRFPKKVSQAKHIFVVGAPRSGTTLVKLILGAHPNLNGEGYETGFFMYKDLLSLRFPGLEDGEQQEVFKKSQDVVELFDGLVEKLLLKTGGNCFIEKTPPHVLRLDFILKYFPNSKIINVFRDGRDAYCSAKRHKNVVQGKNIQSYAKYWRKCVEARLKQGQNSNILDVKYEKLVKEPEKWVKEMMEFVEETYDPRQIKPEYYSQNNITKSKRTEFSQLSKPINASSLNRYKKELNRKQLDEFNKIAGLQLQKLGYDTSSQHGDLL